MTTRVDPAGNTWTYGYDSLGRNLYKVDPDAGTWVYTYDDAGRILSQKDAKLQTTTLEYDTVGRPRYKKIRPSGGAAGVVTETVETSYGTSAAAFNKGRVTQVVTRDGEGSLGAEKNGKLVFEYDALGRVTKQTRTLDGTNYVVERSYDPKGYLRRIVYPDGDYVGDSAGLTKIEYDDAGRLKSIPNILTNVTYNALGAPLVQTNVNGTTTTKTYDPNRFWLTDIHTTSPSLTLQNLHYTLNDAGMATAVDSDVANEDWSYGYDQLNRLIDASNGVVANNQGWTYDSIGRILTNTRVGAYEYSVGTDPKPPHGPKRVNGVEYSYDANGNLLTGNGRTLTWSAETQTLLQVEAA